MSEPARSAPPDAVPGGVVRPISRAATRRCSRPGCPSLATATLTFRYDEQYATLAALVPDGGPETYDLCGEHADRTRPPFGWSLNDDRPEEVPVDTPDVADLSSARTVAVLAAALRGAPTVTGGAEVDTAALDAIVEQPFDDPSVDLYGTVDETDPATEQAARAPADALSELSALSGHADEPRPGPDTARDDHDEPDVLEQVPARTVPGAHRPD